MNPMFGGNGFPAMNPTQRTTPMRQPQPMGQMMQPTPQMNMPQSPFATMQGTRQMFEQFRQNPINSLLSCGYQIPEQYRSDLNSAYNYLVQSGQVQPANLQYAQKQFGLLRGALGI